MTIQEAREKCKSYLALVPQDVLLVGILVLACVFSFGLGFLAGKDAGEGSMSGQAYIEATVEKEGKIVASKTGTKYYLPSCAGAQRIAEKNKVWFSSAEAAQMAGYAPAKNCEGL